MASRTPRDIGTHAETAVVRYLVGHGFAQAERRSLRGSGADAGDVTGTPGVCWQIKAGEKADRASEGLIATWLIQAGEQAMRAHADFAVLVTTRPRVGEPNCGRWWAWLECADLIRLGCGARVGATWMETPIRLPLRIVVDMLRDAGYGTPRGATDAAGVTA